MQNILVLMFCKQNYLKILRLWKVGMFWDSFELNTMFSEYQIFENLSSGLRESEIFLSF